MNDWTITYRLSGPTELRYKGDVIAIGGSEERHALLVSIAQTMNDDAAPKSVYDQLAGMFGKDKLDSAIADARYPERQSAQEER